MAPDQIWPIGLAIPLPAISGALPCTGNYRNVLRHENSLGFIDTLNGLISAVIALCNVNQFFCGKIHLGGALAQTLPGGFVQVR